MKLKKVSRVLSLVVAGVMVLAMAPAAFAANCEHINQHAVDNHNGTCSYVCNDCNAVINTQAHVYQDYNGKTTCVRCDATCNHVGVQNVVDNGDGTHNVVCPTCKKVLGTAEHSYDKDGKCACGAEEPGTTYIPFDATHHRVHTVDKNGKVTYDEVAACVFETGACICGNTCNHVGAQKVVDNGNGTHNVVCPTCKKVLGTAKHSYNENGQCACGATCDHMGQHFKFVANNNGTHNVLCADCDTVVSENVPCTYVDGKCQQCNAEEPACDHMGQHFKFVANNDGTHNVLCADCDAVVSKNVPCTYVDGECEQCGAAQPAPVPTPAPGSSVGPVATTIGLGAWLLVLGGLILGFFGL